MALRPEVRGGLRVRSRRQRRDVLVPERAACALGISFPWQICWGQEEGWGGWKLKGVIWAAQTSSEPLE